MRVSWVVGVLAVACLPASAWGNSTAKCGGGGGGTKITVSCPTGAYAVGISARGGSYVDRFGFKCATFKSNGIRNPPGGFKVAGASGGSTTGSDICGGNQAVTGVSAKAGFYIDRITGGTCGERTGSSGFAAFNPNLDGSDLAMSVGGSGGAPCDLQCAEGEAVYKMVVRYGAWLDSIEVSCKP